MFDLKKLLDDHVDQSIQLLAEHVNPSFAKVLKLIGFDVNYARGQGAYLWDQQGNRYIDCLAGYGTFGCGRNHPVIRDALKQAMDLDLPNLIKMGVPKLSGLLARELLALAPGGMERVFFTNSGAEGVETAIKYARAATGKARMIHCNKSFHGLTMGALSVTGNAEFTQSFGPLLGPVAAIPFNDLAALEAELAKGDVAGFIVEPIQGKGVNIPAPDYLKTAAELCRKHKALFIADEVQTGLGRTGKMFAIEHFGVEPDMILIAKTLSGGYVPAGAVLSRKWIHDKVFSSLDRCVVHSTTFGQNDMAMAAGLATLHVLKTEKLVENAAAMGALMLDLLQPMVDRFEMVKEVRGKGLMVAIEFGPPKSLGLKMAWSMLHKLDQSLFTQAIIIPLMTDHRILTQVAGHHLDVIKLIPPLVLCEADVRQIADSMAKVVASCHKFPGPAWDVPKRLAMGALR